MIRSLSFEADSGHKKFLEDAFENESRVPGGNYGPASVHYTDVVSIPPCFKSQSVFKGIKCHSDSNNHLLVSFPVEFIHEIAFITD